MTVINKTPLNLAEVKGYIKNLDEKKNMELYLKKFGNLSKEKADKLKEEIIGLNNPKINAEAVVKIVDFLPKDAEDINRILVDSSLSEEETNAILKIVGNY